MNSSTSSDEKQVRESKTEKTGKKVEQQDLPKAVQEPEVVRSLIAILCELYVY